MNRFVQQFAKRFFADVGKNVLSTDKKVIKLPKQMPPISNKKSKQKENWDANPLVASHSKYKQSQQKADYFAFLSTQNYPPKIKEELMRRSKAYLKQELQGRKEHTEKFFKNKPDSGHTYWEQQRKRYGLDE